jgi:phosphoglycolate phosphatase
MRATSDHREWSSRTGTPALGFDLDLTLIDMRAATVHALKQVNERLPARIDIDAVIADLGQPFREQLAQWVEPPRMARALRLFSGAFISGGLDLLVPMPGAAGALDALAGCGGRAIVVTGRRGSTARACLLRCGMTVDAVAGKVTGTGKAPAMRRYRLDAFFGDHPLDMAGAQAAGIPGIGVLNGLRSADELLAAGAMAVIPTLEDLTGRLAGGRHLEGS